MWPIETATAIATELLAFSILGPTIRTLHCHFSAISRFSYVFLLELPFRCLLTLSLTFRFLLLGDLRYEIITPPLPFTYATSSLWSFLTVRRRHPFPLLRASSLTRLVELLNPPAGVPVATDLDCWALACSGLTYTIVSGYRHIV
jgi:hypothetical protein